MKRTIKNLLTISIFLLIFLLFGNVKSMASGDLFLNQLDFDVKINSDGSMDVVETWDIDIEETNTLFKTFKADQDKYSRITDVKVSEITNGTEKSFSEINKLMYHVTKNCYYGMENDDGDFEIAWGVGLDNSSATKKYEISYTVEDAVSKHYDYAQLYWQFVGEDFQINSKKITGTITLPTKEESKEEIKVWGHTEDLNGEIYVIGLNKIEFEVNNFSSGRYVEVRTLFPTSMIVSSNRGDNTSILNSVIEEETVWANEANARRTAKAILTWIGVIVANIILILISAIYVRNMYKKIKKMRESKKFEPTEDISYVRELPRKDATPSEAVYVYEKIKSDLDSNKIGKIFSATLLNFNLKKILDFEVIKKKIGKDEVRIKLLDRNASGSLKKEDEKAILKFLLAVFDSKSKEYITVKELQSYIESHSSKVLRLQGEIKEGTIDGLIKNNLFDESEKEKYGKTITSSFLYTSSLITFSMITITLYSVLNAWVLIGAIPVIILSLINLILTSVESSRINVYTQEGVNESEKWKGLKKYMEEFSMLDKREIPEIAIWEEFLVYATAFGIADKVLKQLKIVYPNFESSIYVNTYSCMYLMMNTNFSNSFSNAISSSMSSAYSSATGGGGGFSSGGGGGRRPEVAEVVDRYHLIFNFNEQERKYGRR